MKKNSKVSLVVSLVLATLVMFVFAFASVPLYSLFCKATGYGGKLKGRVPVSDEVVGSRYLKIRFNAEVEKGFPIEFTAPDETIDVLAGKTYLSFYTVKNISDEELLAMAIYNVTPHQTAKYFNKVACFCFNKQHLKPGEELVMPVSFFIDSDIEKDSDVKNIETITLSYTFFKYRGD